MNIDDHCEFCNATTNLTKHHLIPRSIQNRKKIKNQHDDLIGKTITLCFTCHSALHNTFTEKELSEKFYTIDLIKQNELFNKFIKWKLKHPYIVNFPSKMSERKRKRK